MLKTQPTADAEPPSPPEPDPQQQRASFAALLQRINEHKAGFYPISARKRRQAGTVVVGLSLDAAGDMISISVIEECPHLALNKAALKLMERVMEEPFRHGLGKPVTVKIPITYTLD
jgi:TonB family protein